MNPRQSVIASIAALEKKLWSQQAQVNEHQRYFIKLFQNYRLLAVPVVLLPAFLAGWNSGKAPNAARRLKHFAHFVLASLVAHVNNV